MKFDHLKLPSPLIRLETNHNIMTLELNLTYYKITRDVHRAIVTGVTCQQSTLISPDVWIRPICDLRIW